MKRLYYLQQKVGMTTAEATALGTLLGLFLLGTGVKYLSLFEPTFDQAVYAELDSLFAAGTSQLQNGPVLDGLQVVGDDVIGEVKAQDTPAPSPKRVSSTSALRGTIDINVAGRADLQRLPGIGPALADRIIDHRNTYGPFSSEAQLISVNGIGPKTLDRLRPHISVSRPAGE